MMIRKLQHYNIRTTKFDETVAFYRNVLGMKNAPPPGAPASWPASWIYDDSGEAVVHLTPVDPQDPEASYAKISSYRGGPDKRYPYGFSGSGSIDHIALFCEGWDEIVARLQQHDVPYAENHVPQVKMHQLFISDPNGITLELNFQY